MHVHVNAAVALIRLHLYETIQCLSYYYKTFQSLCNLRSSSLHFSKFGTIDYLISVQFARQIKLPGSNMLVQYIHRHSFTTHFEKFHTLIRK